MFGWLLRRGLLKSFSGEEHAMGVLELLYRAASQLDLGDQLRSNCCRVKASQTA
jgi:hypothetical protein